jgi:hypothetical protein
VTARQNKPVVAAERPITHLPIDFQYIRPDLRALHQKKATVSQPTPAANR